MFGDLKTEYTDSFSPVMVHMQVKRLHELLCLQAFA
jgi:hypothetical protein